MTHNNAQAEGCLMVYQSSLGLSTSTLTLVCGAIRSYRKTVGSRWRKLPDPQAALIVLAVLRHDQRPADLARANGISHHTVRRWLGQVIGVLAARAPRLDRVLHRAARTGRQVLLLDGTLIRTHRPGNRHAERAHYSGKHRQHGLLVLGLTDQAGNLLWMSAATPGHTAEITLARRHHLPARLRRHTDQAADQAADLGLVCDLGFTRLDDQPDTNPTVITGRRAARNRPLTAAQKIANGLVSRERITNEHAFNNLKQWRILDRLRGSSRRHATTLLRALLVLTAAHTPRQPLRQTTITDTTPASQPV